MASTTRKWLVGCGLGCAGAIVLSLVVPLGFGLFLSRPLGDAVNSQKALVAAQGDREAWVPPAAPPTPERLDDFLAVRAAVMPLCPRFTAVAADIERMEALDKHEGKPGKGEILKTVARVGNSLMGMVVDIGKMNDARNQALLARHMGLGEYTWLYVLAYHAWLGNPVVDTTHGRRSHSGEGVSERERLDDLRDTVVGLLRRHAEALAAAGQADAAAVWRDEADRQERTGDVAPFAKGGLPEEWATAFAARGDALRASWCEAMSPYDLGQVRKSGMGYQAD